MFWAFRFGAKRPVKDSEQYANGWLGLLRACQVFDPTRGVQFSTYATWWIKQTITRPWMLIQKGAKYGNGKIKQVPFSQLTMGEERDGSMDLTLSKEPDPGDNASNNLERSEQTREVADYLRILDKRTARLVRLHVMEGVTLDECAKVADPPVTRERVRQIVVKALAKINTYVDRSPILMKAKAESEAELAATS